MSTATSKEPLVDNALRDFLKQNDAEADFQTICELAREHFPEMRSLTAKLEEDHDEPGWMRVFLEATIPESLSTDELLRQKGRYLDEFVRRLIPAHRQHFCLTTRRVAD
jgi:hypothetical protein